MEVITVGRNQINDYVINEPGVSKHHAQIVKTDDGGFFIVDMGSVNGTFVNGKRISGEHTLKPGDTVIVANVSVDWLSLFPVENAAPVNPSPQKKKSKVWVVILVVIVLLAAAGAGTWAFFTFKDRDKKADPAVEQRIDHLEKDKKKDHEERKVIEELLDSYKAEPESTEEKDPTPSGEPKKRAVSEVNINGEAYYVRNVSMTAGEFTCVVNCVGSLKDCKIECTKDWYEVSVDGSQLRIKYQENKVDKLRCGDVIISSGDASATLRIEQAASENRIEADMWFGKLRRLLNNPTMTFPDGDKYKGDLIAGTVRNGYGIYMWASTPNIFYIGGWQGNQMNGKGIHVMAKGYEFSGLKGCRIRVSNYSDDQPDGYMACYSNKGEILYDGPVSNGVPDNEYPSSKTNPNKRFDYIEYGSAYYLGETLNGQRHGYGLYVDSDGNLWIGNWSNDQKVDGCSF